MSSVTNSKHAKVRPNEFKFLAGYIAKCRPVARDFERGVLFYQKWTFSKGPNIVTVLLEWLTALLKYLDLALHLIHAMNELLEALNLVSY